MPRLSVLQLQIKFTAGLRGQQSCGTTAAVFGPTQTSVPGSACFLIPVKNPVTFVVTFAPTLAPMGIPFDSYEKFFGTKDSCKFFDKEVKVICASPGDMVYVPAAYLLNVFSFEQPSGKRGWTPGTSSYVHVPLCLNKMMDPTVGPECKAAFCMWSKDVFNRKPAHMCKDRKEFLTKMFDRD